jgi:hypothetical protein
MFALLDDEIMRCKNRLKFLARIEIPSTKTDKPSLQWDTDTLTAELNGVIYNYIRFAGNDATLDEEQKQEIRGRTPDWFNILNPEAKYGYQIQLGFTLFKGGRHPQSYVVSTKES